MPILPDSTLTAGASRKLYFLRTDMSVRKRYMSRGSPLYANRQRQALSDDADESVRMRI